MTDSCAKLLYTHTQNTQVSENHQVFRFLKEVMQPLRSLSFPHLHISDLWFSTMSNILGFKERKKKVVLPACTHERTCNLGLNPSTVKSIHFLVFDFQQIV